MEFSREKVGTRRWGIRWWVHDLFWWEGQGGVLGSHQEYLEGVITPWSGLAGGGQGVGRSLKGSGEWESF